MSQNLARVTKSTPAWPMPSESELQAIQKNSALGSIFAEIRREAATRIDKRALPEANHELWRYTKPEFFSLQTLSDQHSVKFELRTLVGPGSLPKGMELYLGEKASSESSKDLRYVLGAKDSDSSWSALSDLHTSFCSAYAYLKIGKEVKSTEPVLLSQIVSDAALTNSASPLIVISVERGAQACLVEDLDFEQIGLYFPRIEIILGDGAQLEFLSLQRLGAKSHYLARHRLHCGRDAFARITHLNVGAEVSRVDFDCRLYQAGASVELFAFYLADGKRHIDYHPVQEHLAPHCRSELFYKGVLKDSARSVYYGYIKVAEGAQKTDAYQANRNLLLSSDARADSIPNLNIKANDVKCSHGSSVGQVGGDELFYLMSRGLNQAQAERLLVEGFFEELIGRIKNPVLQEFASRAILEPLDGRDNRSGR